MDLICLLAYRIKRNMSPSLIIGIEGWKLNERGHLKVSGVE
jgi:hypothetical protein